MTNITLKWVTLQYGCHCSNSYFIYLLLRTFTQAKHRAQDFHRPEHPSLCFALLSVAFSALKEITANCKVFPDVAPSGMSVQSEANWRGAGQIIIISRRSHGRISITLCASTGTAGTVGLGLVHFFFLQRWYLDQCYSGGPVRVPRVRMRPCAEGKGNAL